MSIGDNIGEFKAERKARQLAKRKAEVDAVDADEPNGLDVTEIKAERKARKQARRDANKAVVAEIAPLVQDSNSSNSLPLRKKQRTSLKASEAPGRPKSIAAATPADASARFLDLHSISYAPAHTAATYPPILSFDALSIAKKLRAGLNSFSTPTPVQSASWCVLLAKPKRDCVAIAETGCVSCQVYSSMLF